MEEIQRGSIMPYDSLPLFFKHRSKLVKPVSQSSQSSQSNQSKPVNPSNCQTSSPIFRSPSSLSQTRQKEVAIQEATRQPSCPATRIRKNNSQSQNLHHQRSRKKLPTMTLTNLFLS